MPYKKISELPDPVKTNLPKDAQKIYKEAYNNAWEEYKNPKDRKNESSREEVSHRVAWSAVKQKYTKSGDDWVEK